MKCPNCEREIPSENFLTSKGCQWCDGEYYASKTN